MPGILLIATFTFLFIFGYHMLGVLDRFLDTNDFCPQGGDSEKFIPADELPGKELTSLHHNIAHRAS